MHFFAQMKPKSYIAIMWTSHGRRSAELDNVLFRLNDDGIYESDELTDEQIDRFRSRPEHVKLVVSGVVPDPLVATEVEQPADPGSEGVYRASKKRVRLKE